MERNNISKAKADESYNGYTNYETWLLCVNIDNDEHLCNTINKMVQDNLYQYHYVIGNIIRDFLENVYYIDGMGIYKIHDSWTFRDWKEINWKEVAECHMEVK